jgi:hypothetical protein
VDELVLHTFALNFKRWLSSFGFWRGNSTNMTINFDGNFNANNLFMDICLNLYRNFNTVGLLCVKQFWTDASTTLLLVSFIYLLGLKDKFLNLFNEIIYYVSVRKTQFMNMRYLFVIFRLLTSLRPHFYCTKFRYVQSVCYCLYSNRTDASLPQTPDTAGTWAVCYSSVSAWYVCQKKQNGIYRYLYYVHFILYRKITDIFL